MQAEARTQFTTNDLLSLAPAFDALANGLPRDFLPNSDGDCTIVDMERLISNLNATGAFFTPKVTSKFNKGATAIINNRFSWPTGTPPYEIRYNQARVVAGALLIKHETEGYLADNAELRGVVATFTAAGRLGTSAMDLLAGAILMPKAVFARACERNPYDRTDGEAEYRFVLRMANVFDLTTGAITLRREALKYA